MGTQIFYIITGGGKNMKVRLSDRHPIMFSIMLGLLLISFIAVASMVAALLKFNDRGMILAQGGAFLLMGIIVTLYMKDIHKSLSPFGFKKIEIAKSKEVLYYIPLLIIALVNPIIGGFSTKLTGIDIIIIIIFAFLVGYTEESIFRGIMKERLQSKGIAFFILFSSAFFGILHMANALSGKNLTSVILQVVNAFLVGLILSLLISIVHNIIPLIAFHSLYDTFAIMTNSYVSSEKETLVLTLLTILYTLYGIYLLFILGRRQRLNQPPYKNAGI